MYSLLEKTIRPVSVSFEPRLRVKGAGSWPVSHHAHPDLVVLKLAADAAAHRQELFLPTQVRSGTMTMRCLCRPSQNHPTSPPSRIRH